MELSICSWELILDNWVITYTQFIIANISFDLYINYVTIHYENEWDLAGAGFLPFLECSYCRSAKESFSQLNNFFFNWVIVTGIWESEWSLDYAEMSSRFWAQQSYKGYWDCSASQKPAQKDLEKCR